MRVGVMITDGGPHSADKWAEESAGEIMALVKVDPDRPEDTAADKERKSSARKTRMYLEADILGVLEPHHSAIQDLERTMLKESDERLNHPMRPDVGTVDAAVNGVVGAAAKYGEPWASAFADEGAKAMVHDIIYRHFQAAMHIERSWHVDRQGHDRTDHAKTWHARFHGGGNPQG